MIEQAPVHDRGGQERGVVAEGAVGARWAANFRTFRYEIRVWRGGHIPDVVEGVDGPRRLSDQEQLARYWLEVVQKVPTPVWGGDELGRGRDVALEVRDRAQRASSPVDPTAARRARAGVAGRPGCREQKGR